MAFDRNRNNNKNKEIFLLFHNTLFKDIKLIKGKKVYLLHPRDSENHIKNAYIYATIEFYKDYLPNISLITEEELKNSRFDIIHCYNPTDHEIKDLLYNIGQTKIIEHDSPLFILNEKDFKNKTFKNNYSFLKEFANIYKWEYVEKSYDKINRQPIKNNKFQHKITHFKDDIEYYKSAVHYVKNKYGVIIDIDILSIYPVTFKSAERNLQIFIKNKLDNFGKYQDAITKNDPFLFHSNISASLNIGLITPKYVYEEIIKHSENKSINNIEGFLRQILGWREYIRYIYVNHGKDIINDNYWNNNKKLKWEYWNGNKKTGIEFLDNEIQKCKKFAYSHHIVRLMIFLNCFVLLGVSPNEIYKWFMKICAIDAYPWCMIPNIWIMGYFNTQFMTKPYLCSSNYISNMSNTEYARNSQFDALFYYFLNKNKSKLKKGAAVYLRNLKYFEMLDQSKQNDITKMANKLERKLVM